MHSNILPTNIPLIAGLSSITLTDEEKALWSKYKPYGFILFPRNIQSQEQVTQLTTLLRETCGHDIYVFIDEEGGKVSRLTTSGIVSKGEFPPAYSFYEIYESQGIETAKTAVYNNYFKIGEKLSSLGINGDFAPVADLLHEEAHEIIGNRSFGRSPEIVADLCQTALEGLKSAGVEGCLKHIPGHGLAKADSHLELPTVDKDLEFLEANDFKVFRKLADSCQFAMTAHILYKCLDQVNPVTISKDAIKYIRDKIGFNSKLITDCITMKALGGDLAQITKDSVAAGCDIVLYAEHNLEDIQKIINCLV